MQFFTFYTLTEVNTRDITNFTLNGYYLLVSFLVNNSSLLTANNVQLLIKLPAPYHKQPLFILCTDVLADFFYA